jgi:hypothetical protein
MTATGIVALFSLLSAASSGAHGSVGGLLSMLSAMRYVISFNVSTACAKVISVSFSVLESVRNILVDLYLLQNNPRSLGLARTPNIGGSRSQPVSNRCLLIRGFLTPQLDTMIDFGFVVAAFVPLVLFWM